jgi:hypothetical protein
MDIARLLQEANTVRKEISVAGKEIQDIVGKIAVASDSNREILTQAASDAAAVTTAEQAAKLSTQASLQKVGALYNTDINAQNNAFVALQNEFQQAAQEQRVYRDQIAKKQSTSFFQNPIEYLLNQFTINEDIARHNAAVDKKERALNDIQALNQATQTTAQTQKLFEKSVTEASAEAAARLAASQWEVKANEAFMQGLSANIEGIKAAVNASKDALSVSFQTANLGMELQRLELSRQAAQREQARLDAALAKEKGLEGEEEAYIIQAINIGRAARGLPPLAGIQLKQVLPAMRSKSALGEELMADYRTGERAIFTGAREVPIAASEWELYSRVKSGHTMNVSPEQKELIDRLVTAADLSIERATKDLKNPLDPKKDMAGVQKAVQAGMRQVLEENARAIDPKDGTNLFRIPPLQTIAANAPTSGNLSVWKNFLGPRAAAGEDFSDPKRVVVAIAEGIKEGKISFREAQEMATLYQQGVEINLQQRAFNRYGLPAIKTFNVEFSAPRTDTLGVLSPAGLLIDYTRNALFESPKQIFDLTKPGDWTRLMSKMMVPEEKMQANPRVTGQVQK